MSLSSFHRAVQTWFSQHFEEATATQLHAWQSIQKQQNTLIAAPTGSGKTLAAFLAAIDELVKLGISGQLTDETHVLYISPLKALSNDVQKNLQIPLAGIDQNLKADGIDAVNIQAAVRTGDTSQYERERMRRKPPHILVTTPESLFILLTSQSGRDMLANIKTVIVDEIHALVSNKRGAHLALSLERLQQLCQSAPVRIGLSATQKPIESVAAFLNGNHDQDCNIIDEGYQRQRNIELELPRSPLDAVMSTEVWQEIYDRLAELASAHKTTLIFVNTRRLAERAARFLAERLGEENVTSHHGSLSKEHRFNAEQRLKQGQLQVLVATASLELGIDIGDIDLVCQLGSPRSISAFLQRIGRAGHQPGAIPKGRLFPLSRDDLLECTAILKSVQKDELDQLQIIGAELDVLAQQIIAEVACREWHEDELFQLLTAAAPYNELKQDDYHKIIKMLTEGYSLKRGLKSRYIHYDAVNRILKPRKGARLTAITNAGVIPDQFDYDVILQPQGFKVGTLNEDFAFESLPGDIFQLGNTSYRILKTNSGKVFVEDANGQPPNIPFWFGEAPGRTDELSVSVSRLRKEVLQWLQEGIQAAMQGLLEQYSLTNAAARQLAEYLAETYAALGTIPSQQQIVLERFFDEAGDQHLVLHSAYGVRVNRAWGLALRKRFCRQFNFELQAAAMEDCIVLSLGATHSFKLEEVRDYLKADSVRHMLTQALLAAPMFLTHWRWNATTALAIKRFSAGNRVPPQFQRADAEDLIALIFPDQLACQENIQGEREVPSHPLVTQTVNDCLHEIMDIQQLEQILANIKSGVVEFTCRDLAAPSPLAQEILNARPYAFLDDAPAEERRTRSVQARRFQNPEDAVLLGRLSSDAIAEVRKEAWPLIRSADELHDALLVNGFLLDTEIKAQEKTFYKHLVAAQRACEFELNNIRYMCCAERIPQIIALYPGAESQIEIEAAGDLANIEWQQDTALLELLRSRLQCLGPVTEQKLSEQFQQTESSIRTALAQLEQQGFVMEGQFSQEQLTEWCERSLLARIHRYTIDNLRDRVKPVSPQRYMSFLFNWHGIAGDKARGIHAVEAAVSKLEGFSAAACSWESDLLTSRIEHYLPSDIDQLCNSGQLGWLRLNQDISSDKGQAKSALIKNTPVSLIYRHSFEHWLTDNNIKIDVLSSSAIRCYEALENQGALFFNDLVKLTGLLRTQLEQALAELAANGLVTSDGFHGLRSLITPNNKKPSFSWRQLRRGRSTTATIDLAGRWSLIKAEQNEQSHSWFSVAEESLEYIAWTLLKRYGVVFRSVLVRESGLPPWRDLLYILRRLEARGEIRGGRFVEGFSGEQFCLPEALGLLRQENKQQTLVSISACDPLNLCGVILPGERIPALANNRLVFKNGNLIAVQLKDKIEYIKELDENESWQVKNLLIRKKKPVSYINQSFRHKH